MVEQISPRVVLEPKTARSVGQRLTHCATVTRLSVCKILSLLETVLTFLKKRNMLDETKMVKQNSSRT